MRSQKDDWHNKTEYQSLNSDWININLILPLNEDIFGKSTTDFVCVSSRVTYVLEYVDK